MSDLINNKRNLHEVSWKEGYKLFSSVLNKKQNIDQGIEIGVAFGGHAESILENTLVRKLYGVDPYISFENYNDPMNLPQKEFDELYFQTLSRLSKFGSRYEHIRSTSKEASALFSCELDFIYIDAQHTYEGVWEDLCCWFAKIKTGGIIGGHDYGHINFPGVKKAIDQFFSRFDWEVNHLGEGVWYVEKKEINISFFIPAYNCSKTILETTDSIIRNNISEGDEIIIVDDGSTDETYELIKNLSEKYKFIKTIKHPYNRGGASARNTACLNAKNDLLFCLDSDNILEENSVQRLKDFLINNGADIAAFQEVWYFNQSIQIITHKWVFKSDPSTVFDFLSRFDVPGASGNYLFTKVSWYKSGGYPEFAKALDAWGFGFRQVASGHLMLTMTNSGYYHRYGHDSYWIRESKNRQMSIIALQLILPCIHHFNESDVRYIFSKKGRYTWFENICVKPIRMNKYFKNEPQLNLTELSADFKKKHFEKLSVVDIIKRHLPYFMIRFIKFIIRRH